MELKTKVSKALIFEEVKKHSERMNKKTGFKDSDLPPK